jgi:hypothetical protein
VAAIQHDADSQRGFSRTDDRIDDETITVPKHGGVLVGPNQLRQVFNDTDVEVLWLIIGAPDNEFDPGEVKDMKVYYPVDPTQLPKELSGVVWPPANQAG